MRMHVSVYLLIIFLAMLTLLFIVETPVRYAEAVSACPPGRAQAPQTEAPPATPAAVNDNTSPVNYAELGSRLLVYLVLAVVLEMALTVVFNWRWFITYAESKGLKTPIAILLALSIALYYQLDVMEDVLNALGMSGKVRNDLYVGPVVTAFLLAGGSDAFFRLFTRLGIRNPFERKAEVLA